MMDDRSDKLPGKLLRRAVHFVGFRDDRYWNAVRIWGAPDFIHETWDRYAADEITQGDLVIFAKGEWDRLPKSFSKPPKI